MCYASALVVISVYRLLRKQGGRDDTYHTARLAVAALSSIVDSCVFCCSSLHSSDGVRFGVDLLPLSLPYRGTTLIFAFDVGFTSIVNHSSRHTQWRTSLSFFFGLAIMWNVL